MKSEYTPWSEAILAGLILHIAGIALLAPLYGHLGVIIVIGLFVVGVVVSRRSTLRPRDFMAYVLLSLVSLWVVFKLVGSTLGTSAIFGENSTPTVLASIFVALLSGIGLLTALRRSERVPYFG